LIKSENLLFVEGRTRMKILYVEIMMAHTNIIVLNLPFSFIYDHAYDVVRSQGFLPVFEPVFIRKP